MPTNANQTVGRRSKGKKTQPTIILTARMDGARQSIVNVDFSVLDEWVGCAFALDICANLKDFAKRYKSPNHLYGARGLFKLWHQYGNAIGWEVPSRDMDPTQLFAQLQSLRQTYFVEEFNRGKKLTTIRGDWVGFLTVMEELIRKKVFPHVPLISVTVNAPPRSRVTIHRQDAINDTRKTSLAPRSFRRESDTYNDSLLEPVSISHSDSTYLDEYQKRLESVLATVRSCALSEFEGFEEARRIGVKLIEETNYQEIAERLSKHVGWYKELYFDPKSGKHFFDEAGNHPNLLGNLLSVVVHEMDGIPCPYMSASRNIKAKVAPNSKTHWRYLQIYGKNRLLPYLGILGSSIAVSCIVLLMLEHPRLNSTALLRAKLEDESGNQILFSPAEVDGKARMRLTVEKPRAGVEKSVVLSPLAERVVRRVIEWTDPIRKVMKAKGNAAAQNLWIGMHLIDYRLIALNESTLQAGMWANVDSRSYGIEANRNRVTPFALRHPELAPWKDRLRFASIRTSSGVLEYLRTGGDLVATARAFGHKNISTTITHYVPEALRLAVYERHIRRHQNLLLAASAGSEEAALVATDFRTTEELHLFLYGLLIGQSHGKDESLKPFAEALSWFLQPVKSTVDDVEDEKIAGRQLVLVRNPHALAIAMLYREHLRGVPMVYLDKPDPGTKVSPRKWCDFVDAIREPLPIAFHEIRDMVEEADRLSKTLLGTVSFPSYT